jgi:N-alpha-acetyl-L-2,4-diaminobutyrate deacetylase
VPFAAVHALPDARQQGRCEAAMRAFAAPYSLILRELDSVGMYDTAAEAMGKVFVSTELGGGGSTTARSVAIAERGIRNFLGHAGILADTGARSPTITLDMPTDDCYVLSTHAGLVEPCVDLGDAVRAGEVVARVHDVQRTGAPAVDYRARLDGVLVGRHFPGLVQTGDCLAVVAVAAG